MSALPDMRAAKSALTDMENALRTADGLASAVTFASEAIADGNAFHALGMTLGDQLADANAAFKALWVALFGADGEEVQQ